MVQPNATPREVRTKIQEAPVKEDIKLGAYTVRDFPTRAALATTLVTGSRAKEIVSRVTPNETRPGIEYGVRGENLHIEEYDGEDYLVLKITVLKKKLMMISSREVAIPRSKQYEPLSPIIEEAFRDVTGPVFSYTRMTLSRAASRTFAGMSYYIHPYLRFSGEKTPEGKPVGVEVNGHPTPMAAHALRHIREQELDEIYRLEDRQIQIFFKWSNTYMGVSETMGRYRGLRDWRMYAQKLLKRRD